MGVDIRVENLNAWYGQVHTLKDVTLHIRANQCTALIGPSGCGKSTFVRCLNRMHETNPVARAEGSVQLGGVDIYKDASPVEIRRRVGMVFQRPNPFPSMTIYENVASQPAAAAAAMSGFVGAAVSQVRLPGSAGEGQDSAEPGFWRRVLSPAQLAEIDSVAGPDLRRVGYLD